LRGLSLRRLVGEVGVSERDFQRTVIEAAQLLGWRVAHFRPAQTKHGWRTPVAADGAGFPDLVLLRGRELLVRELKDGSKLTPAQEAWLRAFSDASVDASVWTPVMWDEIERSLR
jgi:hypothetical protein